MKINTTAEYIEISTPTMTLPIRQIFGIGRNYVAHAVEQGLEAPTRPMVFTKNVMSVVGNGDEIIIPPIARDEAHGGNQTDFEAELAVVIGEHPDGRRAGILIGTRRWGL